MSNKCPNLVDAMHKFEAVLQQECGEHITTCNCEQVPLSALGASCALGASYQVPSFSQCFTFNI